MESSSASLVTKGTQPWTTRGREHEFNRGGAGDKRQDTEKLEASREVTSAGRGRSWGPRPALAGVWGAATRGNGRRGPSVKRGAIA